ncbi:hypothetical protein EVAR_43875_1 [Eumeta japonica]|uniref:Uncharacterized protein n=1 Tax=Eumeta variegata TaxID=151549 RepID=A0A4C1WRD7_EUMVA|nr:hypothetical protein EVAR_43875_1 [Eumeta japonica]
MCACARDTVRTARARVRAHARRSTGKKTIDRPRTFIELDYEDINLVRDITSRAHTQPAPQPCEHAADCSGRTGEAGSAAAARRTAPPTPLHAAIVISFRPLRPWYFRGEIRTIFVRGEKNTRHQPPKMMMTSYLSAEKDRLLWMRCTNFAYSQVLWSHYGSSGRQTPSAEPDESERGTAQVRLRTIRDVGGHHFCVLSIRPVSGAAVTENKMVSWLPDNEEIDKRISRLEKREFVYTVLLAVHGLARGMANLRRLRRKRAAAGLRCCKAVFIPKREDQDTARWRPHSCRRGKT